MSEEESETEGVEKILETMLIGIAGWVSIGAAISLMYFLVKDFKQVLFALLELFVTWVAIMILLMILYASGRQFQNIYKIFKEGEE